MDELQNLIDNLIDLSVKLLYAISEITGTHLPDLELNCCAECFKPWPCPTIQTLKEALDEQDE